MELPYENGHSEIGKTRKIKIRLDHGLGPFMEEEKDNFENMAKLIKEVRNSDENP